MTAADRENQGDDGNGRASQSPLPPSVWKDVFWRIYQNVWEHRIFATAAGVSFYALLAIFPGIAALVALFGLFADPSTISRHLTDLSGLLPDGAIDVVGEQLRWLTEQGHTRLSFEFLLALVISIWSANAGVKALFDALNIVYAEREGRGFIKLNLISLVFTCAGLVFMLLALATLVVLPLISNYVGRAHSARWLVVLAKWPLLLLAIALADAMIYRYGPSRGKTQWRWISWGSAFATISWLAVSVLFSWYAASFDSYNRTYGSLGAVIAFMTWIWLSSIVILLGAELDAEMERQTTRDTTRDRAAP
jgi:membrane protein